MAKHDNWQTPPDVFGPLDEEFGFDLDAAASPENAKCDHFITAEQDALITPWSNPWAGRSVWCNPPYSRLPEFTARAMNQWLTNNNTVVLFIPAYTDTRWWRDNVVPASEVRFLTGRVRFWENGAPGKDSARFPSAAIIYRPLPVGNYPLTGPRHTYWRRER
jgi:phage N-6-adenine-methyltransferase